MKTFYSVTYAVWGVSDKKVKWFDNLDAAKEFEKCDYTDNAVTHNFKDAKKIKEIEGLIHNMEVGYDY